MDTLTVGQRSERMRRVKSKDTKPELELRRLVWRMGHRYRKNRSNVIGHPDIVFLRSKRAIFLHGCFWHRHECVSGRRVPKSKVSFWQNKFKQNIRRDDNVIKELRAAGWRALVVWECELRDQANVEYRLKKFLDA